MAQGINIIVAAVEQTWDLSVTVAPVLFLTLFAYFLARRGTSNGFLSATVSGQRDMVLAYSEYLVFGLVLGGVTNLFLGTERVVGVLVVAAVFGYALLKQDPPETTVFTLKQVTDIVHLVWVGVLLVSLVGVFLTFVALSTSAEAGTGLLLMKSVLAVVFYATIFWEL